MPAATPERPWLKWYSNRRWARRARFQLQEHPLCKFCLDKGIVTAANVADHIEPHRGEPVKFWYGPLQSLCPSCHSSSKQQIEAKGFVNDIGPDGFPLDKQNHPFWKRE